MMADETRLRQQEEEHVAAEGRLLARPSSTGQPEQPAAAADYCPGLSPLGLSTGRDGLIYVPTSYTQAHPLPLLLMLHGAGGNAYSGLAPLDDLPEKACLIVVAPDTREGTWDVIMGEYGPDVQFINRALAQTFARYAVGPAYLAIGGFSDGASYALSLGLTNGDLFGDVIAFSPGFMAPGARRGQPRIFISHGTRDAVLGINHTSRRLVPRLRHEGYAVRYEEFDGVHTVPPQIAREAVTWFTGRQP